ncbi:hypothetical protein PWEIH_12685 [Listeria weihenstephanensis FSL R9-0317]|uniref:Uncharacterized protein n=1 Tax=Listeria weihenstephanensis TaxID=1006155 RepID=A0A1S7FU10_9LIST|nr:hypothetical protein [Listeria weihenstephanensis]AQY50931.1 hypothetical protein UE46_07675 [Listeria weihenstephanensis]EUJ36337.1 hypothetical protein PWEIH_12685 [Listeria weihenstephanensis FSL R9-0317]MBC1499871.1 hypothetical protein [Listeria weihenstephanensis]
MTKSKKLTLTGHDNYIIVENQSGQHFKLDGTLIRGGFIADATSIQAWHTIDETIPISQSEKDEIMTQIMQQTIQSPFKIIFEEPGFESFS